MTKPATVPSTSATVVSSVSAMRWVTRSRKASIVRRSVSPSGTRPGCTSCQPRWKSAVIASTSSAVAGRRIGSRHAAEPRGLGRAEAVRRCSPPTIRCVKTWTTSSSGRAAWCRARSCATWGWLRTTYVERSAAVSWSVIHPGVCLTHTGDPTWLQRAWGGVLALWPAALCRESALRAEQSRMSEIDDGSIHIAGDRGRSPAPPRGIRLHRVTDFSGKVRWGGWATAGVGGGGRAGRGRGCPRRAQDHRGPRRPRRAVTADHGRPARRITLEALSHRPTPTADRCSGRRRERHLLGPRARVPHSGRATSWPPEGRAAGPGAPHAGLCTATWCIRSRTRTWSWTVACSTTTPPPATLTSPVPTDQRGTPVLPGDTGVPHSRPARSLQCRHGAPARGRHRRARRARAAVDAVPDGLHPRREQAGRRLGGGVPVLPDPAGRRRRPGWSYAGARRRTPC